MADRGAGIILLKNNPNLLMEIEEIVYMKDISYIDAVADWCASKGYEIEYAASLIRKNPSLKAKIQAEGLALKMLKRIDK